MLKEGVSDHCHERVSVKAVPGSALEVRTIDFVLRELLRARDRGSAVLLLSADLDEVWHVADRVMVMSRGRVRGPVPLSATSRQEVGHWMTGTP